MSEKFGTGRAHHRKCIAFKHHKLWIVFCILYDLCVLSKSTGWRDKRGGLHGYYYALVPAVEALCWGAPPYILHSSRFPLVDTLHQRVFNDL
jgi:hypothetical protein